MWHFYLYDEPAAKALNVKVLAGYLREKFPGSEVVVRETFHRFCGRQGKGEFPFLSLEGWARLWAGAKVLRLSEPVRRREPLPGEITYEQRRLAQPERGTWGLLYDGMWLQAAFRELLPPRERRLRDVHLIFTAQLLGTYDEDDRRYHARVIVAGVPHLISTTGLVEAPAKPREYYLLRQYAGLEGTEVGEEKWGHFCLLPDDPRTTEALKGYVLQAAFYQLAGEAFCGDKHCRLYNAHWQEELLRAQFTSPGELCARHERLLTALRRGLRREK
ncbi:MAG TPA: hypothetical protein EYP85_07385 [Armatimonadetes bacterium]|nr:hypothetical protein [Armatimonadota bacterium]